MTLQLIDAHQSPLRKAFLELADINSPPQGQPTSRRLATSQVMIPEKIRAAHLQPQLVSTANPTGHTASNGPVQQQQWDDCAIFSSPLATNTSDKCNTEVAAFNGSKQGRQSWGVHTHNLRTKGYTENESYNDTFNCHKLLSEDTFMTWSQIKEVMSSGALSNEVIRTEFRKAAVACALARGDTSVCVASACDNAGASGVNGISCAPCESDYLYSKSNKQMAVNSCSSTTGQGSGPVYTIDMMEFSCLMARLELLYEEGNEVKEENERKRSEGLREEVALQDHATQESAIADDVKEMYYCLINMEKGSTHQHGLSFDMLMSWDKMQEAVVSSFVSAGTVNKLFRSVVKRRNSHKGSCNSSSSKEHGLNLMEFDQFCSLLQQTIDADGDIALSSDDDSDDGDNDDSVADSMDGEERIYANGITPPASPTPGQELELQLELQFMDTTSSPSSAAYVSPITPLAVDARGEQIVTASTLEVDVYDSNSMVSEIRSNVTFPETRCGPAVATDLDTSVVGCHDYSFDNMDPHGNGYGHGCSVLNEVTFLQVNTRLDETGVVRTGSGVSMAGDLYKKDSRAMSSLGPDVSVLSATACERLWSKTFFALRGHMLTHFDTALQKVVACDVRECKARIANTPKVLRKSEPEGFKFVIISRGKCMYLVAGSEGDRSLWVEMINEHMHKMKGSFLEL
jgi:hypothetical protein